MKHGNLKIVECDKDYDNNEFDAVHTMAGITAVNFAANDHEGSGLLVNAGHVLRSFLNRIQSCDKRSFIDRMVAIAASEKTNRCSVIVYRSLGCCTVAVLHYFWQATTPYILQFRLSKTHGASEDVVLQNISCANPEERQDCPRRHCSHLDR